MAPCSQANIFEKKITDSYKVTTITCLLFSKKNVKKKTSTGTPATPGFTISDSFYGTGSSIDIDTKFGGGPGSYSVAPVLAVTTPLVAPSKKNVNIFCYIIRGEKLFRYYNSVV